MNPKLVHFVSESIPGSALSAALGMILLVWPSLSGQMICYGLGIGILLFGAYRIIGYFRSAPADAAVRSGLSSGILMLALALFLLLRPELIISMLPSLFGLFLIMGAAREVQSACDLYRMAAPRWFLPLIGAIVQAVLGLIIFWNPFSTALTFMRFIGVSLLLEGTSQIVFSALTSRSRKGYVSYKGGDGKTSN